MSIISIIDDDYEPARYALQRVIEKQRKVVNAAKALERVATFDPHARPVGRWYVSDEALDKLIEVVREFNE